MNWIKITEAGNIPLREGRAVQVGDREIAIFNLTDRFLAIDNRCPHSGGPLCDGITSGASVACPLHGWKVCLETGSVLKKENDLGKVGTYPVRVRDGVVEISVSA